MVKNNDWYSIENVATLDTPALAIYPDRVKNNIDTLVKSIDDVKRLRPHIKTHKSSEVTKMMLDAGIKKFKCATIAEAEMLAAAGAPDVILAYQPLGPKANRLAELTKKFPSTSFAALIDNLDVAKHISQVFTESNQTLSVYIDLNVGMNRTGIVPQKAMALYEAASSLKGIKIAGLHAYDGHIRDVDFAERTKKCDEAFATVVALRDSIESKFNKKLTIVAGGTPTYSVHCKRKEVECSPGTFVYWDKGYEDILKEQKYQHAAIVVSRIVSKPTDDTICVDLGHKAIAAENPLDKRVFFLNAPDISPTGHSEEHMVFKIAPGASYDVGDVLYGVPFHVCPTIALHDRPAVVVDHQVTEYWTTLSRNRKITV
jgi:D-serine deaminase-like pyridoxal phosphate-dependent protein